MDKNGPLVSIEGVNRHCFSSHRFLVFNENIIFRETVLIFNSYVLPKITCGSETCTHSKKIEQKIIVTQNLMERAMLNIKLKDNVKIKTIEKKIQKNQNTIHIIKRVQWNWTRYVGRMNNNRWTYQVTAGAGSMKNEKQVGRRLDDKTI